MKSVKDMVKIQTNNHNWCCPYVLKCQLECPTLHHRCLCRALVAISDPQSGWHRRRPFPSYQPRLISIFMAILITVDTYQCSKRAISAKMVRLVVSETTPYLYQQLPS